MTSVATIQNGQPPEPTEPAKAPHPVVALFTSDMARRYIEKFLPDGVNLERVAATVMIAMQQDKTKTLAKCTPESLVLGVAKIQQWGLELGTTAHLIPFKDKERGVMEATPVADYKGLAELMIGSGAVRFLEPKVVYEGDHFDFRFGTDARIYHTPGPRAKRGKITHGYILIHFPGGRIVFDVMPAEDIDEIRQKFSKQWKVGPLPAWYVKKTLVRQSSKLIPKNPRFAEQFAKVLAVLDDEKGVELEPAVAVSSIREAVNTEDDEDRIEVVNEAAGGDEPHPSDADTPDWWGASHTPPF
jgi:recombination protein RecT